MSTNSETVLRLAMTALVITAALGSPASAQEGVPFSGEIEGTEGFDFKDDGSGIIVHGSGGGTASVLGRFTATWDADVTFSIPDSPIERTFVANNGDELYAEGLGAGTPPDPDQSVVETHVIIGGTGRFSGASGSFTVERFVFNVAPPFTDLETSGSFSGSIVLAGIPFRGELEGTEGFDFKDDGSGIIVHGSGRGTASVLGRFTATWDADVTFSIPDSPIERTFVANNGDELYAEGLGAGTPPDPDQSVVETHVITGGTGRFSGASGSFTVERFVFDVAPPFTDLETSGSFSGSIVLIRPRLLFRRGDSNDDGDVDLSDAIETLGMLFLGDDGISCQAAADANDDGTLDVSDAIATLDILFLGHGTMPLPGMNNCGVDPTDNGVSCEQYGGCP